MQSVGELSGPLAGPWKRERRSDKYPPGRKWSVGSVMTALTPRTGLNMITISSGVAGFPQPQERIQEMAHKSAQGEEFGITTAGSRLFARGASPRPPTDHQAQARARSCGASGGTVVS
jgi:hypothetical protein